MSYRIKIKPLSVNEAYRGRRFSSNKLKSYKSELSLLFPKISVQGAKFSVYYRFGVASRASDGDNLIKAFQDCLSERYGFNDNQIYKWEIEKVIVKKGKEFIEFSIDVIH